MRESIIIFFNNSRDNSKSFQHKINIPQNTDYKDFTQYLMKKSFFKSLKEFEMKFYKTYFIHESYESNEGDFINHFISPIGSISETFKEFNRYIKTLI